MLLSMVIIKATLYLGKYHYVAQIKMYETVIQIMKQEVFDKTRLFEPPERACKVY